jgi:hypothetical protein
MEETGLLYHSLVRRSNFIFNFPITANLSVLNQFCSATNTGQVGGRGATRAKSIVGLNRLLISQGLVPSLRQTEGMRRDCNPLVFQEVVPAAVLR